MSNPEVPSSDARTVPQIQLFIGVTCDLVVCFTSKSPNEGFDLDSWRVKKVLSAFRCSSIR